ncbi:MAG: M23 family metallopeptidase [Corynebacteriales bacterium]|nr:M23 family metallopeptidase [Mycobacteriales bacterium]
MSSSSATSSSVDAQRDDRKTEILSKAPSSSPTQDDEFDTTPRAEPLAFPIPEAVPDAVPAPEAAAAEPAPEAVPAPEPAPLWIIPTTGFISSTYGYRPDFHGGLDLAAPEGTPVFAASTGVVQFAGMDSGGYGNLVILDHGNGIVTYYGHNSVLTVQVGQTVNVGDQIAEMGSTGDSTGPHLHFEVRIDDTQIDPLQFLREQLVAI